MNVFKLISFSIFFFPLSNLQAQAFFVSYDAGISAILTPTGNVAASSVTPSVTLKNFGTTPLTSVKIYYKIDNGTESLQNWTGSLAPNATATIALNSVTGYAASTTAHTFTARTSLPNNTTDNNTANDATTVSFTYSIDAGISAITTPIGNVTTSTVTPSVTLKNFGTTTLTSVKIFYKIDNGTETSQNWTGSLAPNATATVTLSSVTGYAASTTAHTFTVRATAPNGQTDNNTANDATTVSFTYSIDAGISAISTPNASVATPSVTPSVTLKNFGTTTLTSVKIFYKIDNGTETSQDWIGSLAPNSTVIFTLNSVTGYAASTTAHTFAARTSLPNGATDNNATNDATTVSFTYSIDAGISAITAPNGNVATQSVTPSVTLKNFGTTTLTSIKIFYKIDNGTETSQNWTGSLAPNATATVTLSFVTGYAASTTAHTFTVRTSLPNNTTDNNTANDATTVSFTYSIDAGISAISTPIGNVSTPSVTPSVILKNFGTTTLTSVKIFYKIDNGIETSQDWIGSLAPNSTAIFTLNSITGYAASTTAHTFAARTSLPNGATDNNATNDATTVSFTYSIDAGISAITTPIGNVSTPSVTPSVILKNFGTTPLTSVKIFYKIDNGIEISQNWTGSLAPNATATVALNSVTGYAASVTAHTFTVRTSLPNNTTDNNTANDATTASFTYSIDAGISAISTPIDNVSTPSVAPSVTLKNFGTTTLTTVKIFYKIDNGTESSQNWTGSLAPNGTIAVALNSVTGYAASTTAHTFTARTSLPNGATDNNAANDATTVSFIYSIDAGISAITTPTGNVATASVTPSVTLMNFGTTTLTTIKIFYKIDNGTESSQNWTGNLAAGSTTTVTLSNLTRYTQGIHTFRVRATAPNGQSDNNTRNDKMFQVFIYQPEVFNDFSNVNKPLSTVLMGSESPRYSYAQLFDGTLYKPNEVVMKFQSPPSSQWLKRFKENMMVTMSLSSVQIVDFCVCGTIITYGLSTNNGSSIPAFQLVAGPTQSSATVSSQTGEAHEPDISPNYYGSNNQLASTSGRTPSTALSQAPQGFTPNTAGYRYAVIDSKIQISSVGNNYSSKFHYNPSEFSNIDKDESCEIDPVGYNYEDNNNNPFIPFVSATLTHGTAVFEIINQTPTKAKAFVVSAFDEKGVSTLGKVACALQLSVNQNVSAMNNSFGIYAPDIPLLRPIINEAEEKCILLACAVGNGINGNGVDIAKYPFFPASFTNSNIVRVAAHDRARQLGRCSNYSKNLDVIAALGEYNPGANGVWTSYATPQIIAAFLQYKTQYQASRTCRDFIEAIYASSETINSPSGEMPIFNPEAFGLISSSISPTNRDHNVPIGDGLTVYPNPISDNIVKVQFNGASNLPFNLEITDVNGRVILTKEVNDYSRSGYEGDLDISRLPKGVFLLKAYQSKEIYIKKIIKL